MPPAQQIVPSTTTMSYEKTFKKIPDNPQDNSDNPSKMETMGGRHGRWVVAGPAADAETIARKSKGSPTSRRPSIALLPCGHC